MEHVTGQVRMLQARADLALDDIDKALKTVGLKAVHEQGKRADRALAAKIGRLLMDWWRLGPVVGPANWHEANTMTLHGRLVADLRLQLGKDAYRLGHRKMLRLVAVGQPGNVSIVTKKAIQHPHVLGASFMAWMHDPRAARTMQIFPDAKGAPVDVEFDLRVILQNNLNGFRLRLLQGLLDGSLAHLEPAHAVAPA